MGLEEFREAVAILKRELPKWNSPAAKGCRRTYRRTPFTTLISVILSFRTKDEVTCEAANRLMALADTPEKMVELDRERIAQTIYPVGFYNQKADFILKISRELLDSYGGEVPDTLDQLVQLPGVGPKAAKIVLEHAFGHAVVAVDTHVHRILNRWGLIETTSPEESDRVIEKVVPMELRKGLNRLLVAFGQTICSPKKPACETCPVRKFVKCSTWNGEIVR
ncbi:MAG: endonuclease III [Epsilonproteobacteria bacterium]|nr:endonuclease III [Campylobacterota bacterium]NPA56951.1 endonuclease III [Campylobacterota bacterium]